MSYTWQCIVVLMFAVAGYSAATWLFLSRRVPGSLLALLLTSLMLKCFMGAAGYLHPWDERYHALVAKHLMEHPLVPTLYDPAVLPYDAGDWAQNHVWLHKPPLTLWLIAGAMKLFGTGVFVVRVPSIVLSTLGILLTYGIGRRLFGEGTGFLAALFHALCGIMVAQAAGSFSTDHVDTVFVFFVELGVYCAVRHRERLAWKWAVWMGVAIGLALLAKWLAALIVLPVWLGLVWDRKRLSRIVGAGALALAVAAGAAGPWQIYVRHAFPEESRIEAAYNWKHLTVGVEGHAHGFLYHFGKAYELFGVLVYPGMILTAMFYFRRRLPGPAGVMLIWVGLTYGVFSLAATKMGGYVLIAAPGVFVLMALVLEELQKGMSRKRAGALFLLFAVAAGVPIVQRMELFYRGPRMPLWVRPLSEMEKRLPAGRVVVFNDPHPIETMFDTGAVAYSKMPSEEDLARVRERGYQACVLRKPGEAAPGGVTAIDVSPLLYWRD